MDNPEYYTASVKSDWYGFNNYHSAKLFARTYSSISTQESICDNLALCPGRIGEMTMTEKMKAARFYEVGKPLRIDKIPVPKLGQGDVLVEIRTCGICGSDIQIVYEGVTPTSYTPITLGHEPSGVIFGIGYEVKDWKIGDRVTINPFITCGKCINCLSPETHRSV